MRSRAPHLFILLLLLFPPLGVGAAGQERSAPTYEVCKAMLKFAEAENYSKVKMALSHIEPLFVDIERKFNISIKQEILSLLKSRDKIKLRRCICRLIYLDILALLNEIETNEQTSITELKRSVKIVYLQYLLLSRNVFKKRFPEHQKIRKIFQRLYQSLSPTAYTLSIARERTAAAMKIVERLESALVLRFPELRNEPC